MTLLEAASALRKGEVSSVELTRASLSAIERLNPRLNAFLSVFPERAMEAARAADEALSRGDGHSPLLGIPVAVKDVYELEGEKTTCGSLLYRDHVSRRDAAVVERLKAAGAVIVGKTTLHELAYGVTSNNPHFGAVHNPWNLGHVPGGSSGGSGAAVAAGLVFMALGSDTGGSIRIPAAYCGTVGLKPTFGRVSRYGVMPLDFSLDHMGPLTRGVGDAAATLEVIAGADSRDDTCSRRPTGPYLPGAAPTIRGVRIGVPENYYFDAIDPEAESAVRAMIETARGLGAEIVAVRVPDIHAYNAIARVILFSEASALMERYLDRPELFGDDVRALLEQGRLLPATDYVNAQRLRRMAKREFAALWKQVDCLLTPCAPVPAPPIGATTVAVGGTTEDVRLVSTRFVRAINLLGLPALSIPCGLHSSGLPLGLQIIGQPFDEAGILRVGAALEDATFFRKRTPPVHA